jgi:peroxiredoxin Q/BCP
LFPADNADNAEKTAPPTVSNHEKNLRNLRNPRAICIFVLQIFNYTVMAIAVGDKCPEFTLKDQNNTDFDIKNVLGKQVLVIYFYPKDDTPGCTAEACSFRDSYEDFKDLGCEVIGISSDSPEKHAKFAEKHRLSFTLLADTSKTVRKLFGVPGNLFGLIPGRVTYIIDKKGIVRHIYNSLTNAAGHIEESIKAVKSITNE